MGATVAGESKLLMKDEKTGNAPATCLKILELRNPCFPAFVVSLFPQVVLSILF